MARAAAALPGDSNESAREDTAVALFVVLDVEAVEQVEVEAGSTLGNPEVETECDVLISVEAPALGPKEGAVVVAEAVHVEVAMEFDVDPAVFDLVEGTTTGIGGLVVLIGSVSRFFHITRNSSKHTFVHKGMILTLKTNGAIDAVCFLLR